MPDVKSRRELYSEYTRTALLEAGTSLFAERGFAHTTLQDVAEASQVTRGAVYHHFTNKQALFEAVLESLERGMTDRLSSAAADVGDPWRSAIVALDGFLEQCCDPAYSRIVWREGMVALGWDRWRELEEEFAYGLTERLVRELVDSGYIAPLPIEPTAQLIFAMLGAAGFALASADPAQQPEIKKHYAAVIERFLSGLRADDADR